MTFWLRLRYPRFCFASSDLLQQFHEMQQVVFELRRENAGLRHQKASLTNLIGRLDRDKKRRSLQVAEQESELQVLGEKIDELKTEADR